MSRNVVTRHRSAKYTRWWIRGAISFGVVVCAVLAVALVFQLWRTGALMGGRRSRHLYPSDGPLWLHLLVNHVTVSWLSRAVDTLGPLGLLCMAAWLSIRRRRLAPVICAGVAVALAVAVVFAGKGLLGRLIGDGALTWSSTAVSGPAIFVVVVAGLVAWLPREHLASAVRRPLWSLAAAAALVVGVAQLYLGHRVDAVLLSWLGGLAVLGVVLLTFGRPAARAWWLPRQMR